MVAVQKNNMEVAQSVYESFNEGDLESALATMADDVEWREPDGIQFGGTHRGPAEVRENVFEPCMVEFDTFRVVPDRFVDGGDTVVVLGMFHATTESGERVDSPFAHVYELQDGRITRFANYTDTALWTESA